MDRVSILSEREEAQGWVFEAEARDGAGRATRFTLRLSFVDYNHWSPDGSDPPEAVARAALRFILSREPSAEIASSFDAARLRRRFPDADDRIPSLIER